MLIASSSLRPVAVLRDPYAADPLMALLNGWLVCVLLTSHPNPNHNLKSNLA